MRSYDAIHGAIAGISRSARESEVHLDTEADSETVHTERGKALRRQAGDALQVALDTLNLFSDSLSANSRCHVDAEAAVIAGRSDAVLVEIRAMEIVVEDEEAKHVRAEWRNLVRGATKATTKKAFQASQLPVTWRPEEVQEADGVMTADPLRVLQAERDRLNVLRCGNEGPDPRVGCAPWGGGGALPKLTPAQVRTASGAFPRGTAETYDGLHVSHFRLLSDEALGSLCDILELCECLCILPTDLQTVEIALIPKPKRGHRPYHQRLDVGAGARLLCQFQRCGGHRPGTQPVKAEAARTRKEHYGALLWDLAAFFETINHDILLAKAERFGFPMVLVRMAVRAFKAPRMVGIRKRYAEPIHPGRGVLAGHAFAMAMVHLYYLDDIDGVLTRNPDVSLDVYVDDHTLTVMADAEEQVVDLLEAAAIDLHAVVTGSLRCDVSWGKAATAASSQTLTDKIRDRLGEWAGKFVEERVCNLGTDFQAGKKRGKYRKWTVRGRRLARGALRKKKLRNLKILVGRRIAGHVFASGVLPAIDFGADVTGFDDAELLRVQRIGAAATSAGQSGRSLTANRLVQGDPTWKAMVAPAARWQKELWRASFHPDLSVRGADGRRALQSTTVNELPTGVMGHGAGLAARMVLGRRDRCVGSHTGTNRGCCSITRASWLECYVLEQVGG